MSANNHARCYKDRIISRMLRYEFSLLDAVPRLLNPIPCSIDLDPVTLKDSTAMNIRFAHKLLLSATLSAAAFFQSAPSLAQDYPSRNITMVMPYAAGGPGDIITRLFASAMQKQLGQTIVVDNPAGAGGSIGTAKVARSAPDGYTLLMIHISHATNVLMIKNLPYSPIDDFEPIGLATVGPMVVTGRKDLPTKDAKEFVAYIKENSSKISMGHAGIGSASHLCSLMFMDALDVKLTLVPYKGAAPALNDVIAGHVDGFFGDIPGLIGFVRSGQLKAIGIAAPRRHPLLPEVRTFDEMGVKGVDSDNWYALFTAKAVPAAEVDRINRAVRAALANEAVRSKLSNSGAQPTPSTPAELATLLRNDSEKWARIVKAKNIKPD